MVIFNKLMKALVVIRPKVVSKYSNYEGREQTLSLIANWPLLIDSEVKSKSFYKFLGENSQEKKKLVLNSTRTESLHLTKQSNALVVAALLSGAWGGDLWLLHLIPKRKKFQQTKFYLTSVVLLSSYSLLVY
jgi:hypothetical protein